MRHFPDTSPRSGTGILALVLLTLVVSVSDSRTFAQPIAPSASPPTVTPAPAQTVTPSTVAPALPPVAAVPAVPNAPVEKLRAMAVDTAVAPDLAQAALLAAQLVQPNSLPEVYLKKLDELAGRLRTQTSKVASPAEAAATMAAFLYGEEGFANSAIQTADVFVGLDQVLDKKQWNCLGMTLLYCALGKRLGYPIQAVAGRGHVLATWNGDPAFFIETTAQGGLQPSREYLLQYLPFPCVTPNSYAVLDERGAIAMTLSQMGLAMQHQQRTQLASTLFELAIQFSDYYAEAYAGRGFLRVDSGNTDGAIADFRKALEIDPNYRDAYGGLGTAYRAQGSLAQAVDAYRTLVSQCPEDSAAVFNAGQLLYESGDLEGAVYAYRRYIDLQPQDPEGYMRIAYPLEDGGDLQGAAMAYQEVLRLAPATPDALVNLGNIFEKMGDLDSSIQAFRQALTIQPTSVLAMGGVARILGKANRYDEALLSFRQALQVYPNDYYLWFDLGQFFENFGNLKQALSAYQEATRAAPSNPEGYYSLARLLQQAGLLQDAQRALAQAQTLEQASAGQSTPFVGAPQGGETTESLFGGSPEVSATPLEDPAPPVEPPMEKAVPAPDDPEAPGSAAEPVPKQESPSAESVENATTAKP